MGREQFFFQLAQTLNVNMSTCMYSPLCQEFQNRPVGNDLKSHLLCVIRSGTSITTKIQETLDLVLSCDGRNEVTPSFLMILFECISKNRIAG